MTSGNHGASAESDNTRIDRLHTSSSLDPQDLELVEQQGLEHDNETDGDHAQSASQEQHLVPKAVTRRLYISHFLSTWNSRSFEFGAVLFLAVIFPETLLMLSIYAIVRSASAIVLAPVIGRVIDTKNRLAVVRLSIVAQRVPVIASCIGFYLLLVDSRLSSTAKNGMFAMLVVLSCIEKNASVLNTVSVERDWVVVIARSHEPTLRTINARIRRIDLFCKLAGPLFIALVNGASSEVAILVTLGINAASVVIEYFAIAQVYKNTPSLHTREIVSMTTQPADATLQSKSILSRLKYLKASLVFYYKSRAFLPSFSLSLLYFTVLSFGGQMVTYLLASGYTSFDIALTRTLSVVFELSATWIAPRTTKWIGAIRAGMWFLSIQMICLGAAVSFFWTEKRPIVAASGLVGGTILSRIGLWGYDLSAQLIIQSEIEDGHRGSFSSTEAALQNLFELLSYASTIIFSRPMQFKYPTLLSTAAVYSAGCLYGIYLRERRGHLFHLDACIKPRHDAAANS